MKQSLKDLAVLKLKVDLYEKLYNEKVKEIKKKLSEANEDSILDEDNSLKIKINTSYARKFSPDGVRTVFGEKADSCIIESIDTEKFDTLAKSGGKYVISEAEQKKCFISTPRESLTWDGLDTFKAKLAAEAVEKAEKTK